MKIVICFVITLFAVDLWATPALAEDAASSTTASGSNAAGTSTSSTSLSEALGQKKFHENEISDPEMRARSGSLSRYSATFTFGVNGPILSDFSADNQPNPEHSIGSYATSVVGDAGLRFRLTSNQSIALTTGLSGRYPFRGMRRTDVNNPTLSYDVTGRFAGIQMRNAFGLTDITVPEYNEIGMRGRIGYILGLVDDVSPHVAVDWSTLAFFNLYDRSYEPGDRTATQYQIILGPGAKYLFNDRINVYTNLRKIFDDFRSVPDPYSMKGRIISERIGIGYSYTRDIYITPYISIFPTALAMDQTTINGAMIFSGL